MSSGSDFAGNFPSAQQKREAAWKSVVEAAVSELNTVVRRLTRSRDTTREEHDIFDIPTLQERVAVIVDGDPNLVEINNPAASSGVFLSPSP